MMSKVLRNVSINKIVLNFINNAYKPAETPELSLVPVPMWGDLTKTDN